VVFGGNDGDLSFNSVDVLQRMPGRSGSSGGGGGGEDWQWFTPVCVGEPPRPRTGHAAVLVNRYLPTHSVYYLNLA
jgi:hypothetical protein